MFDLMGRDIEKRGESPNHGVPDSCFLRGLGCGPKAD